METIVTGIMVNHRLNMESMNQNKLPWKNKAINK